MTWKDGLGAEQEEGMLHAVSPDAADQVMAQQTLTHPGTLGVLQDQTRLTDPLPPTTILALSVEPPGGSPRPTAEPLLTERLWRLPSDDREGGNLEDAAGSAAASGPPPG